jgi:Sulfotransferase family
LLDFLGIGAQKAATSWMYRNLGAHPQIRFPAGKEVHFWDRPDGRTVADWRNLFERNPGVYADRLRHALDPRFMPRRQGEITPAYAFLSVDQIAQIAAIYPALRLLFNVRNPIERAWSHARMRWGRTGRAACEMPDAWLFAFLDSEDCVKRTDYLATLRNWSGVFGEEPLLVTVFDDIVVEPAVSLARMTAHIGVAPFAAGQLQAAGDAVNSGPAAAMPAHVRSRLVRRYRNDIARLGDRLGRNLDHWLAPGAEG